MHDIDSALDAIRARDAAAATLAHGMWTLMRNAATHPRVTRYDVQRMLWGAVPYALRRPSRPDGRALSEAFAELLARVGYPRYAEICRDRVTTDIFDAAEDENRCAALIAAAWRESGVEPPDTPILAWGRARGPVEDALHGAVGRILEEAVDAGTIEPGAPDAQDTRVKLTMRALASRDDDSSGTWFARLLDERLDLWVCGFGQTRREMLVRLRPEIRQPPDPIAAGLPALQSLLAACRDGGARLTERGYLPTALVRELAGLMPLCRDDPGTGRTESSCPPVSWLREFVTGCGLVHVERRRLRLTTLGRRALDDLDSLLMLVGEHAVIREHSGYALLQEVVLAALLLESWVDADRLFDRLVLAFEDVGMTDPAGQPITHDHPVMALVPHFAYELRALGAAEVRTSPERLGLTEAGRSVARWALRARVMLREVPA